MFKLTLKKKLMIYGAAAVLPILFLVVLLGGGGSAIDQAEQAIAQSSAVIEKITDSGGVSLPYVNLDGKQANQLDGKLRLHFSQGFTATGIILSLKAESDVTVTIYSVTEKQSDKGETVEELQELKKTALSGNSVISVSLPCAIDIGTNFIRLKITDSNGSVPGIELYALGFNGILLKQ